MERLDKNKRWQLYVLRLKDGKFYVGITSQTPEIRMHEHLEGIRSAYWTAKHKPLEVIYREDLGVIDKAKAEKRENRMVRALMEQRGINNVRGGDLTSVEPYTKHFGYFYDPKSWEIARDMIVAVFILNIAIAYLLVDKYFLR